MTTIELLQRLVIACQKCDLVEAYAVREMDEDTLSVRVFLSDGSFISVFYNIATARVAFALIKEKQRIYGKDNAKMGWHAHPFDDPEGHYPCEPVDFEGFLKEVERHFSDRS
ncbi:MAG TPA: hypothetical protein EYP49_13640 [Anaerolineae bacterium]|nr:hypothetical protein [Anaerolineae bacterium]